MNNNSDYLNNKQVKSPYKCMSSPVQFEVMEPLRMFSGRP